LSYEFNIFIVISILINTYLYELWFIPKKEIKNKWLFMPKEEKVLKKIKKRKYGAY